MAASALSVDHHLSLPERRSQNIETSEPTPFSFLRGADAQGLRDLACRDVLNWSISSGHFPVKIDRCRKVIGALVKEAEVGGDRFALLSREDQDWILDNIRLLRTALREVVESRHALRRQPELQGHDGCLRSRPHVIADSFLSAIGFCFDEDSLCAYLSGWQESQLLGMGELWALKPMLQLVTLERLADIILPFLDHPNPALLFVPVPGCYSIPRL